MELQLVISLVTVLGAGISVYVGVRVALAEIKGDIRRHDERFRTVDDSIASQSRRLDRLEEQYFQPPR